MSQVEVDSANPYKNKLRNAKKKLTDIEALENSGKQLDEGQQQKIKTKKKVEKEIADVQASYDNWNKEQIAALNQAKQQAAPKAAPKAEGKKAEQKQQPKPEAKKAEKAAAKKEETPAQQQAQKQQAVKAEKQPQKQAEKNTPPPPAAAVEIDESLNPYRNSVRNAKKKIQAIEALEGLKELDEAQQGKLKTKKKVEKELADAQANYDQWITAQRQALESQSKAAKPAEKAKPAAKQQPAKQEQKPQAKQAEQKPQQQAQKPAAKQAEQKPQQAQKPAAKKEAAPAKQAAPAKPAASEEEVKTARNKVRNLEKKLKQIEELKAKGKGSLSAEQQEKITAEKKTLKEYNDAQAQLKKLVGDE